MPEIITFPGWIALVFAIFLVLLLVIVLVGATLDYIEHVWASR